MNLLQMLRFIRVEQHLISEVIQKGRWKYLGHIKNEARVDARLSAIADVPLRS